jgi:uncharacterized phage infection (PIP) family protein YhgE
MTDTNIGRQSSATTEAMARARQAASGAAETASNLAGQASGLASKAASAIASEAQHKATGLMQQQMEASADYVRLVSGTAQSAARQLENKAPELARLVQDAAGRAEQFADDLKNKDVEEIVEMAWDFARRNPRMFLGGAIAAGFLLARFAKSSAERAASTPRRYASSPGATDYRTSERTSGYGGSYGAGSGLNSGDGASTRSTTSGGASYAG